MNGVLIPESHCPACGYLGNAATCVTEADAHPKEGDFSLCICCRSVNVFRADLTLRIPSEQELEQVVAIMQASAS